MKASLKILILFYLLSFKTYSQNYTDPTTGIIISFTANPLQYPCTGYNSSCATPISASLRDTAINTIKRAFNKYPTDYLKRNIKKVFVFDSLAFDGYAYGGTYFPDSLFILITLRGGSFDDQFTTEKIFHHEFSSIVFYDFKASFDSLGWVSNNYSDFRYPFESGYDMLKNPLFNDNIVTCIGSCGFLSFYSMAALEEDINVLASNLFLPEYNFWKHVEATTPLLNKVNILVKLYKNVSPDYDIKYFKSFDLYNPSALNQLKVKNSRQNINYFIKK